MRRSGTLWRGSGCLRHKILLHQIPVQRLTARCWAGGMAIDFFWSGGGINLVRTLVPIAVNCSKNPGVTNAAPCTFLHEGRKTNVQHHSQADDLRARFKIPEWGVFCHTERLRDRSPSLKLDLSDSTGCTFNQTHSTPNFVPFRCNHLQRKWR